MSISRQTLVSDLIIDIELETERWDSAFVVTARLGDKKWGARSPVMDVNPHMVEDMGKEESVKYVTKLALDSGMFHIVRIIMRDLVDEQKIKI